MNFAGDLMKPTRFANGYVQQEPYRIFVLGPDTDTVRVFFNTLRQHLMGGTATGDTVLGREDRVFPGQFRAVHNARDPWDGRVVYDVTLDQALATTTDRTRDEPIVDAFVVIFRVDSAVDWQTVRDFTLPRVVAHSDAFHPKTRPKQILYLVSHQHSIFDSTRAFTEEQMRALKRWTHLTYRSHNLAVGDNCLDVISRVVRRLDALHSAHQAKTRITDPYAEQARSWSQVPQTWLQSLLGVFAVCTPSDARNWAPSDDEIDPERADDGWHVVDANRATPMGAAV